MMIQFTLQYFKHLQHLKDLGYLLLFFFFLQGGNLALAHDHSSSHDAWTEQFYQQFLRYHRSENFLETQGSSFKSHSYLRVWGEKIPLNSEFYQLMRVSLHSLSQEYNEFCDHCLVKEVEKKAQDSHWLEKVETKLNAFTELRGTISGIKKEYGRMALVGYVIMEMLEHTFLGPLGICPILNMVYFSSLDTVKSMLQVLKFSRDFRFLSLPSVTQSIKTGVKIFLLKRRASQIFYEFHPQLRQVYHDEELSKVTARHLQRKFKKHFFWQETEIDHLRVSLKEYKKLSTEQKRKRWLYWKTEIQRQFSRRLLWPIAYQELVLDPSLQSLNTKIFSEGAPTPHSFGDSPSSFLGEQDLKTIFSPTESFEKRLSTALYFHEYFNVTKNMMLFLLKEDLEHRRITRQQYLSYHQNLSSLFALQSEFSNYLITASLQKRNHTKLQEAHLRAQNSLKTFLELPPLVEEWFRLSESFDLDSWKKLQEDLKKWHDEKIATQPWLKKSTPWDFFKKKIPNNTGAQSLRCPQLFL
jgi:hypothetical protein